MLRDAIASKNQCVNFTLLVKWMQYAAAWSEVVDYFTELTAKCIQCMLVQCAAGMEVMG